MAAGRTKLACTSGPMRRPNFRCGSWVASDLVLAGGMDVAHRGGRGHDQGVERPYPLAVRSCMTITITQWRALKELPTPGPVSRRLLMPTLREGPLGPLAGAAARIGGSLRFCGGPALVSYT